jgi:hypothetical protein
MLLHVSMTRFPAVGEGLFLDDEVIRVDAVDESAGTLSVGGDV